MRKAIVIVAAMLMAMPVLRAQPDSSQYDASGIVFATISGPLHNSVVYAPKPPYPPAALQQRFTGRGVYKMDLDNGTPYDVRIVQSSGHKMLDDAAVETLRTWRFEPHRLTWATIPIEFRLGSRRGAQLLPPGAKAIAVYAPKPEYPLEARQKHFTGSGIFVLDVDVGSGRVTEVRTLKSMGHQILDDAVLNAFRRWRFKPGTAAPHVKIPIQYTMTGTNY